MFSYIGAMVLITVVFGVGNVIAAWIVAASGRKELAQSFMLSASYVWLIGPGLCFGGWPILENI